MAPCRARLFKLTPHAVRRAIDERPELKRDARAELLTLWPSSTIVRAMSGPILICGIICREIIR
jgi:hypothetical protein